MSSYAYYNGKFGKVSEITVPLSDRSIYFADAIYDAAIGVYDRILWENEHIDRFMSNAKRVGMSPDFDRKYLSELLREVAIKSMVESYFIYFQLSRSSPTRTHSAINCGNNLLITVSPIEIRRKTPAMRLMIAEDRRHGYCDIKTTDLLPSVMVSTKAESEGYDEAVFVRDNIVTECAKSNIAILKQGRVITHPLNHRILPGITRSHLKIACDSCGIEFCEREFTREELFSADEILITGTSKLCRTAKSVNGTSVGGRDLSTANRLCDFIFNEYSSFCLT